MLFKFSDGSTTKFSLYTDITGFDSTTAGTKTIKVYFGKFFASFDVEVKKHTISMVDAKLTVGNTKALFFETDMPEETKITWSSNDETVATVAEGVITAKTPGKAIITASFEVNGIQYSETAIVEGVEFSDVSSSGWYYTAVKFVTDNGYFTGYSNSDKFGTADNIQRQDFVVALARLDGVNLDAYSGSTSFADVPKGSYYAKAVQWASQNGIVTGYSHNNKFGVGDNITREQLVTMFYRYIKNYKGEDVSISGNAAAGYPDYSKVSVFSKDAVDWAIAKGVISGKNGNIAPVANAQRCEVATIIYNMFQNGILHE